MESRVISDAQITASSEWDENHAAIHGRLNFPARSGNQGVWYSGAWSSGANDQNQWLQVDIGISKNVTHLATQGRNAVDQWVTSYTVEYSTDGASFQIYRERGADMTVRAVSCRPVVTRYDLSAPLIIFSPDFTRK